MAFQDLPPVPYREKLLNQQGFLNSTWSTWFRQLFVRVGGNVALTNGELVNIVSYPIAINKGGTGHTNSSDAINALLPDQDGNDGKALKTAANVAYWADIPAVPTSYAASAILPDTSGFNKNLSALDDTLQKCLNTLNALTAGGSFTTQNFTGTSITTTEAGFQRWRYTGTSPQTMTAPTLTSLPDSGILAILGTSNANTLSIPEGLTGIVKLNGPFELGLGNIIKFMNDSTLGGLCEISRC
jgi:hypothetical protein